jgi:hypothetical protein
VSAAVKHGRLPWPGVNHKGRYPSTSTGLWADKKPGPSAFCRQLNIFRVPGIAKGRLFSTPAFRFTWFFGIYVVFGCASKSAARPRVGTGVGTLSDPSRPGRDGRGDTWRHGVGDFMPDFTWLVVCRGRACSHTTFWNHSNSLFQLIGACSS